jgi:AbrB family looped-hinge helix DNA binding protein
VRECLSVTLPRGNTQGKIFPMKVSKVTSKGQITIPVVIRSALAIDERSRVEVSQVGDEIAFERSCPCDRSAKATLFGS